MTKATPHAGLHYSTTDSASLSCRPRWVRLATMESAATNVGINIASAKERAKSSQKVRALPEICLTFNPNNRFPGVAALAPD